MLPEVGADLDLYAKALGVIADRYDYNASSVTQDDFRETLHLSTDELARLWAMLDMLGGPWRGGGFNNSDGSFHVTPSEEAYFYSDISTYAEVKIVLQGRADAAERIRGTLYSQEREFGVANKKPQLAFENGGIQYHLADGELDVVFQRDLRELNMVREIEAWKAASFLAGSCVEAILLDLLLKHPEKRTGKQKNDPASQF